MGRLAALLDYKRVVRKWHLTMHLGPLSHGLTTLQWRAYCAKIYLSWESIAWQQNFWAEPKDKGAVTVA